MDRWDDKSAWLTFHLRFLCFLLVTLLRIMKSCASNRKGHPLAARIKRLMQKDDEVGRIASVTPILISTNASLIFS